MTYLAAGCRVMAAPPSSSMNFNIAQGLIRMVGIGKIVRRNNRDRDRGVNSKSASLGDAHGFARRRVLVLTAAGLAAAAAAGFMVSWQWADLLIGWDTAAVVFLGWVGSAIVGKDSAETMQLALREDNSRAAADLILLFACVGSLGAVVLTLLLERPVRAWLSVLVVASVVLSWLVVHTIFTLRYARLYYGEPQGGVDFNDKIPPCYTDFAYLAFTIGMTYQVSDTNLTSKIRKTALQHALLSFLFGTVIIATAINAVVGLLK